MFIPQIWPNDQPAVGNIHIYIWAVLAVVIKFDHSSYMDFMHSPSTWCVYINLPNFEFISWYSL